MSKIFNLKKQNILSAANTPKLFKQFTTAFGVEKRTNKIGR